MAGEAEQVLALVQYHGEKHQWNFEKYALMHLHQHLILKALMAHGYTGINAGFKVFYLLNGVKCAVLNAVRTRIMSDKVLRTDFARCITLFKDFVKQSAQTSKSTKLAGVRTSLAQNCFLGKPHSPKIVFLFSGFVLESAGMSLKK
jgi:hypothetical protein